MNSWWRSPWPQWRSHWHVLHAWPVSAQVLVLWVCSLCLTWGVSLLYSQQAWQAWWSAEEETLAWQASIDQLHTQVQAHQARVASLNKQVHPSGAQIPIWQIKSPVSTKPQDSPPQEDAPSLRAAWLMLAKAHGLQVPPSVDEHNTQWIGPLPHLLAAWQRLPQTLPHHAMAAFELSLLPGTNQLQLSVTWLAWADAPRMDKTAVLTSGRTRPAAVLTSDNRAESQVLHNPFASDGLRSALPNSVRPATPSALTGIPLSAMRWTGMLQQAGRAQALVVHAGQIHPVQLGQAMGQDFGEVVQIAPDHVLLREWHVNALGQWQMQHTRFPSKEAP
jgi:hypothetical protein